MSRPKKRPVIDRRRVSERQKRAMARIEEMQDKAAIDVHKEEMEKLNAIRDSFNDAVWDCTDTRLIHDMFSLLCRSARPANARLIAEHPDCPEEVREELAARLSANRRGAASKAKPATSADA